MRAETSWTCSSFSTKKWRRKKVSAQTMKHKKPLLLAVGRKKCNCYLGECAESDHYLLSSPYFLFVPFSPSLSELWRESRLFPLFLTSSETLSRYSFIASSFPHTLPTSNLWGSKLECWWLKKGIVRFSLIFQKGMLSRKMCSSQSHFERNERWKYGS